MKKLAKWLGVIVLLLALAAGGVYYVAFFPSSAITDGQDVAPGARTIKDGFVSVFMLDAGGGKVVLIDAGNDKKGAAIRAELTRRKLDDSTVAAIFLTHGHGDHTAAAKTFPNATIYALVAEVPRIGTDVAKVTTVSDGEKTTVGELTVETFAVPGHTVGSAVFLAKGVLFFGDSAGGGKSGKMLPAVGLFSSDSAQNVSSLKALSTRLEPRQGEVKTLAFAHTGPLEGYGFLSEFARSH